MTKAAGAVARAPGWIWRYVEYDVVRVSWIRDTADSLELIEPEGIADPPGDHVVGAGCITADADATDSDPVLVESEAAAEDVHAADALADHGIGGRAE